MALKLLGKNRKPLDVLKTALVAFSVALIVANSGIAEAANKCEILLAQKSAEAPRDPSIREKLMGSSGFKKLAEAILSFGKALGRGDTTSLRQEDKYVVSKKVSDEVLENLTEQYGENLTVRDQRVDGEKNVTVTQYMQPILIPLKNGRILSAKIRFRKYFRSRENKSLANSNLKPSTTTAKRQFFEIKIDHPIYDRTVLKPRLLVDDSDVELIRDPKLFEKNKSALRENWLKLNPETSQAVIDTFITTLDRLYAESKGEMKLFAQTKYVRESYSLKIPPSNPAKRPLEVQITIDREVTVQSPERRTLAYAPEDVVIEIKVPLAHASLTAEDMKAYPGLASVKEIKSQLKLHHNDDFHLGAGKLSTFRRFMHSLDN